MTRNQIEQEISKITAQLKGQMTDLERALLVEDRKDLREKLAQHHTDTNPLSSRDLAVFLKSAIEAAAAGEPGKALGGVTFCDIKIDEEDRVRANLSDGSLIWIEPNHMVPRGYFNRT
jgi:hypothetical protein